MDEPRQAPWVFGLRTPYQIASAPISRMKITPGSGASGGGGGGSQSSSSSSQGGSTGIGIGGGRRSPGGVEARDVRKKTGDSGGKAGGTDIGAGGGVTPARAGGTRPGPGLPGK